VEDPLTDIPQPRWATIAEAETYTGRAVSQRTLRRWIHSGRLTGHRIGPRRIQIDLNELDALRHPITPGPEQRDRPAEQERSA
jgi:excisionase family DNA binding protein